MVVYLDMETKGANMEKMNERLAFGTGNDGRIQRVISTDIMEALRVGANSMAYGVNFGSGAEQTEWWDLNSSTIFDYLIDGIFFYLEKMAGGHDFELMLLTETMA